ncbi:MAG: TIGR03915 family putative DNA repair protein [Synergistaceae bacterium]|jgi:probable DNA metabolism protein|nr:TIGR03915 family putative DNA repair protein [Synergistaceae bacterium]
MIYLYDGSWDGLMCLVCRTAKDAEFPDGVLRSGDFSGRGQGFLFETARVETVPEIAEATAAALKRRVSGTMLSDAWFALLSDSRGIEMALLKALAKVWARGRRAEADLADGHIHAVRRAALRTGAEYNKYLGVTRFKDVGGLFYSELEPDCDVLTLLAGHFSARLPDRGWVLHDRRRGKAAVYDTRSWFVTDMNLPQPLPVTEEESAYQELWREFYRSTTTRGRLNCKVQRGNMPKKYWKHLVETPGEVRGR